MRVEWAAICREVGSGESGTVDMLGVGNQISLPLELPREIELPVAVSLIGLSTNLDPERLMCEVSNPSGERIGRTVFEITAHPSDDGPAGIPDDIEARGIEPIIMYFTATTGGVYRLAFSTEGDADPFIVAFYVVEISDLLT
jgi:hypothetical protein